jgi:hypothetical protein
MCSRALGLKVAGMASALPSPLTLSARILAPDALVGLNDEARDAI